jgi:RNA polymerase sigma-70 factor (ECF subfamily)
VGDAPRFVLGVDEPLYLSLHGPGAEVAPAGGSLVSLLHYHRAGTAEHAVGTRDRLEAPARRRAPGLARPRRQRPVPAPRGGEPRRPPSGEPRPRRTTVRRRHRCAGVLVAGDWVGPRGLLSDAAVASGAEAGRVAARIAASTRLRRERTRVVRGAPPPALRRRLPHVGSVSDAEDVVQDAWLRWAAVEGADVDDVGAFLTTVVSRLSLDRLRSARHRRERYVGPWLPRARCRRSAPQAPRRTGRRRPRARRLAHLRLPHRCSTSSSRRSGRAPAPRRLRVPVPEVADMVDRSEAGCRQLASRARRRPAVVPAPPHRRRDPTLRRAGRAVPHRDGDRRHRQRPAVLAPDVVLVSDGGPTTGRRVARCTARPRRPAPGAPREPDAGRTTVTVQDINGEPGIIVAVDGVPFLTLGSPAARRASTGCGSCGTRRSSPTSLVGRAGC